MGLIASPSTFASPQHDQWSQSITGVTQIWIEPVKRADGRRHYTSGRGLLMTARLGSPDGEILEAAHNAVCEACRVLMSRGIVGPFETWKQGILYPCMMGDIEKVAGLSVYEPDDGGVHFARWRPLDQNAVSLSAVLAPAREEDAAGKRGSG
jgi:hypothetical protein